MSLVRDPDSIVLMLWSMTPSVRKLLFLLQTQGSSDQGLGSRPVCVTAVREFCAYLIATALSLLLSVGEARDHAWEINVVRMSLGNLWCSLCEPALLAHTEHICGNSLQP